MECFRDSTESRPRRSSTGFLCSNIRNAQEAHIYIRPSDEHRFITLDDISETSLATLSADGFNPCAVVETSAGNFEAWVKHSRLFPKLIATFAAQT